MATISARRSSLMALTSGLALAAAAQPGPAFAQTDEPVELAPASMPSVGTVDERFQSYNVEMVEVTGGRFWRPYSPETFAALENPEAAAAAASPEEIAATPAGMNPALYEYRPPIDLSNERLRKLASALAPAFMRVSGTWANTTWFAHTPDAPEEAPEGYDAVLTQDQWRGVVDFAKAVGADIATSMPISNGTRNAEGVWTPDQARVWFEFTDSIGGEIAAAEYFNEPTVAAMGGAPEGYTVEDYGRDFRIFRDFVNEIAPDTIIHGPGAVGETADGALLDYGTTGLLRTPDLLAAGGAEGVEAFSFHHYGAVSIRCEGVGAQTTPEAALSEEWLARTDATLAYYKQQRHQFVPDAPLWNTETGETACGGNPWAKTFLDTFRYVDQLGRNAKDGLVVHMHNTLAASDYALIDDQSFLPRPSYWAALLWRNLMGTTVLDTGIPIEQGMHVYAHCLRGTPGGVAMVAINNDLEAPRSVNLPMEGERYTLSSPELQSEEVLLNGEPLALGENDDLPQLTGAATPAGELVLDPATITFVAVPTAGNPACS
jgi:hypothetical protein